ncbi:MAG: hypothetical protein IJQ69_05765 [Bacteroidales bacterium]|nr:hypothetical protein [Bacteroidales bacterium]MBR0255403.1 hypothetical protein [Bacteroidales bacterium]
MNRLFQILLLAAALLLSVPAARAQEPQQPDIDQIIANQIDNLTRTFKLDEVQVFFVDSILQYNYHAMNEAFEEARKTGASNADTYQAISDQWMQATDEAFQRFFTKDQWNKYMKSSYGKEKQRREKRISERNPASSLKQ